VATKPGPDNNGVGVAAAKSWYADHACVAKTIHNSGHRCK